MKRTNKDFHNLDDWLAHLASEQPRLAEDACCEAAMQMLRRVPTSLDIGEGWNSDAHIVGVLDTLAELEVDPYTICAAAVVHFSRHLPQELGATLAKFPDAVSDLYQDMQSVGQFNDVGGINLGTGSAESLRRLLLAMVKDIRVILPILADHLVRMRNVAKGPDNLRKQYAEISAQVFAPLANRLGIWQLKWELEDLAFRYLQAEAYKRIARLVDERRTDREKFIKDVVDELSGLLQENEIEGDIQGRPKHIFSIWRKMQRKGLDYHQLYDIRAVRILVDDVPDCYAVLGLVHNRWQYIPGEFDDYIATPKGNNYQSLHTAVIVPGGKTLEVQIRTSGMHEHAEKGVAAHWRYKDGTRSDPGFDQRINWLRQLLETRDDDSGELLLADFEADVAEERVYVLTPDGKVLDLKAESTVLDFAYHVHTEVGHRCAGAKVNGRIVPLTYQVQTGEQVEILTRKNSEPSRDWLNPHFGYLVSASARSKLRQWFKRIDKDQNLHAGKDSLEKELKRLGLGKVSKEELAKKCQWQTVDELYVAVGRGDTSLSHMGRAAELLVNPELEKPPKLRAPAERPDAPSDALVIDGVSNLMSSLAKCCTPVRGDRILGYITKGAGVTVHRADCANISRLAATNNARVIEVGWGSTVGSHYSARIQLRAFDRKGLLRDISAVLANLQAHVSGIASEEISVAAEIEFRIDVKIRDFDHLSQVINRLHGLPNVLEVERIS